MSIRLTTERTCRFPSLDANLGSEPKGESQSPRKTWYYVGNSNDWHVDEHFERVRYREIYPGIDLVFLTSQGQLEYSFEIAPGADPSAIRIRYGGLRPNLVPGGNLEAERRRPPRWSSGVHKPSKSAESLAVEFLPTTASAAKKSRSNWAPMIARLRSSSTRAHL